MCFDAKTSMEGFIISSLGTGLLYFSGDKNKVKFAYFWLSVTLIQLWEYLIWKNIDNEENNRFWTNVLRTNIAIQPLVALLVLNIVPSHLPKQVLQAVLLIELFLLAVWLHEIYEERKEITVVNSYKNLKWPGPQPGSFSNQDLLRTSIYFLALTVLPWFVKPFKTGITVGAITVASILLTFLKTENYNIIKNSGWTSIWCYASSIMPILQYIMV